jgi:putative glutathione S-transferase
VFHRLQAKHVTLVRKGGPDAPEVLGCHKKEQTIVSEESEGILWTLDSVFRALVPSTFQLYPGELREEIRAVENGLLADISVSLVKCIFAKDSDTARDQLERGCSSIATLDELLSKQRYLVGKGVTEADVRLFNTLIRVDVSKNRTSQQTLTQFPNVVGVSLCCPIHAGARYDKTF